MGVNASDSLKQFLEEAKLNNGNVEQTINPQALNPIVRKQFNLLCTTYIH